MMYEVTLVLSRALFPLAFRILKVREGSVIHWLP